MESPPSGWSSTLARLAQVVSAAVRNRMELFAVELQEETRRFMEVLVIVLLAVGAGLFALALLTFLIVLAFWEEGRLAAVGVLAGLYLLTALLLANVVRRKLSEWTAFEATIEQLRKDQSCLADCRNSGNENKP